MNEVYMELEELQKLIPQPRWSRFFQKKLHNLKKTYYMEASFVQVFCEETEQSQNISYYLYYGESSYQSRQAPD